MSDQRSPLVSDPAGVLAPHTQDRSTPDPATNRLGNRHPTESASRLGTSAVAATEEATWAAHRRRDVSASWERPSLITQIQTFAAELLDLDLSAVLDAMNQTDTFLESVV